MQYRPEGWKNPHNIIIGGITLDCSVESQAYEAGADAILEALKREAYLDFDGAGDEVYVLPKSVFIEDDDE